jgi:hypothetical protein
VKSRRKAIIGFGAGFLVVSKPFFRATTTREYRAHRAQGTDCSAISGTSPFAGWHDSVIE